MIKDLIEDPKSIKNEELWNLDGVIAKFILPRLMAFKERFGHDITQLGKIDKMIYALEYCVLFNEGDPEQMEYDLGKVNEGFEMLGKHLMELWD